MRPNRSGFTLIELLVVVLIVGVLAAIAIPKFASTKERAYVASMRMDLHNLAIIEEAYFFTNNTYTTVLPAGSFQSSKSNTVTLVGADAKGWSALVTSSQTATSTPSQCGIWVGDGVQPPTVPADTLEGVPGCS
ncbi:MAG TPA: prepilin-type N-terminal cleavage/methylation domain-containing protein [Gemmatimonadaceae bacterium]|nr:prepilin-type N-terminal cleavage/methylation domain-containing protein [Gemmatimonadaceae bacterium]